MAYDMNRKLVFVNAAAESLTSAGPYSKTRLRDRIQAVTAKPLREMVANAVSGFIDFLSGSPTLPQNARAAATSLSTAGTAKFNAAHPEGVPTSA